eukprot:5768358-Ditylum_brightwellii.AAC.1
MDIVKGHLCNDPTKAVTPDKIPPKKPTAERKIDLTKSESAGQTRLTPQENWQLAQPPVGRDRVKQSHSGQNPQSNL